MTAQSNEVAECRVRGRLSRAPEVARTAGGVPICRLIVVKDAAGPASSPVRVGFYGRDELAERCGRGLREGDLIEGIGTLANRLTKGSRGAGFPEILVQDVKLRERAAAGT